MGKISKISWFSESLFSFFSNGTLLTFYYSHVPSVKQRVVDKDRGIG